MTVGDRLVRAERLLMLLGAGCTEEGLDTYGSIEQMANTLHRFLDEVEYEVLVAKDHLDARALDTPAPEDDTHRPVADASPAS